MDTEDIKRFLIIDPEAGTRSQLRDELLDIFPDAMVVEHDPVATMSPPVDEGDDAFDGVFLEHDLGLPEETGFDWLHILQLWDRFRYIVLWTNSVDPYLAARSIQLGADAYLCKKDLRRELPAALTGMEMASKKKVAAAAPGSPLARAPGHQTIRIPNFPTMRIAVDSTLTIAADKTMHISPADRNAIVNKARRERVAKAAEPQAPEVKVTGYEILEVLASSWMSTVYLGRQPDTGEKVVVKVLFNKQDPDSANALKRFIQEYTLISRLRHPNVCQIFERRFSVDYAVILMEYLPAGDLDQRIKRGEAYPHAVEYLKQIAAGLSAVHAMGIVHRDLKPGNILFHGDGTLGISDFGIAKVMGATSDLTMVGEVIGTPSYMSPEQATGKAIDTRSDLYSLGAIFYEMLTGRKPFTSDSVHGVIYAHVNAPIPKLLSHVAQYQPIIDRLMAKDPKDRFQSTDELLAAMAE